LRPVKPAWHSPGGRNVAGTGTASAHMATIKRFCGGAVAVLLAGGAIADVIAAKVAVYFWRFPY